jgi:hypothetical protein
MLSAAVADLSRNCMQHRGNHASSSLSGCHRLSRIAGFWMAVFIVAMALNWSSGTASGATSSYLDITASFSEAVNTNPAGIVETHVVGVFNSCARDHGVPRDHAGTCDGCCSFSNCGGVIVSVAPIGDHPEPPAQFPSAVLASPRNLLLPPITRPPISPIQ